MPPGSGPRGAERRAKSEANELLMEESIAARLCRRTMEGRAVYNYCHSLPPPPQRSRSNRRALVSRPTGQIPQSADAGLGSYDDLAFITCQVIYGLLMLILVLEWVYGVQLIVTTS